MLLRPIRPGDAPGAHAALRPPVTGKRLPALLRGDAAAPPDWARILADVDHDRRAAIVAADPEGELIGVARYGTEPGADEAEIAVVVQDAWQGRGLGTILLSALLDHAVSRGITKFLAYVLADNHRMLRLVGRQGVMTERSHDQGVVSLRFTRR
ncbi:MAG: GNAT family N-acetyltransferase [Candidatus Rokuibacteriota bacterium]